MANRAYAGFWCGEFSEAVMLDRFEQLLATVPFSRLVSGFTALEIRAVGPEEGPLFERDLRTAPLDAKSVVDIAREYQHADCAYEVQTLWDLWIYDTELASWQLLPQRLEIFCWGEEYDQGACKENGHFQFDVGFEHLFTGHASLLGVRGGRAGHDGPQHPLEQRFLERMRHPRALQEYREKTSANIRQLLDWIRRIESAIPIERYRLTSEGEENFEARLDEILALR